MASCLEAVAGRGGMGVVYRARQRRPDRIVALKVIASELAEDPKFRARFERESRIAAQIEHPNVIPVHSAGEADGVLYIAMRFVNGTDMRALRAQEGRLEPICSDGSENRRTRAGLCGLLHSFDAESCAERSRPSGVLLLSSVGCRAGAVNVGGAASRRRSGSEGPATDFGLLAAVLKCPQSHIT
jgi:hypothetical protein